MVNLVEQAGIGYSSEITDVYMQSNIIWIALYEGGK